MEMESKVKAGLIKLPVLPNEVAIAPDWFARRDELIAGAEALGEITSDAAFRKGSTLLKDLTPMRRECDKLRLDLGKPFAEAKKRIDDMAKEALAPLTESENGLKAKLAEYSRQKAAAAAAEQERLEREAREKAEDAALEAELFGGSTTEPVTVAVAPPTMTDNVLGAGVKVIERLVAEVVDVDQLPRRFMVPSMPAINQFGRERADELKAKAREAGGEFTAHGIRWRIDKTVQA